MRLLGSGQEEEAREVASLSLVMAAGAAVAFSALYLSLWIRNQLAYSTRERHSLSLVLYAVFQTTKCLKNLLFERERAP